MTPYTRLQRCVYATLMKLYTWQCVSYVLPISEQQFDCFCSESNKANGSYVLPNPLHEVCVSPNRQMRVDNDDLGYYNWQVPCLLQMGPYYSLQLVLKYTPNLSFNLQGLGPERTAMGQIADCVKTFVQILAFRCEDSTRVESAVSVCRGEHPPPLLSPSHPRFPRLHQSPMAPKACTSFCELVLDMWQVRIGIYLSCDANRTGLAIKHHSKYL